MSLTLSATKPRTWLALATFLTAPVLAAPTFAADSSALFNQALHDSLPESVLKAGEISFGALWETPPTIGTDPTNPMVPVGIAPDIAALLGEVLGVDVEWQNLQWPAQLPGVQAGTVDALFGQISVTPERETSVVDLVAWQKATMALLVPAGNPGNITRLDSMCGLTIAVPLGSNQIPRVEAATDRCETAGKEAIKTLEYQGANAAVQALRAGTVDAWLDSTGSQFDIVSKQPDVFSAVEIPSDEVPTEFGGIAIAKSQPALTEAIAGALKVLVDDGAYGAIMTDGGLAAGIITADEVVINPMTHTPVGVMAE